MPFQGACQFVQCRAGGHYVINDDDAAAAEVSVAGKGVANVLVPLFPWQAGLGRCVVWTGAGIQQKRNAEFFG